MAVAVSIVDMVDDGLNGSGRRSWRKYAQQRRCLLRYDTAAAAAYILDIHGIPRGSTIRSGTVTSKKSHIQQNECTDLSPDCMERALDQGCITDFINMEEDCPRTCLLCNNKIGDKVYAIYNKEAQDIHISGNSDKETLALMEETDLYMYETVYKDEDFAAVATQCQNAFASCSFWTAVGECTNNSPFMSVHCAAACKTFGNSIPGIDNYFFLRLRTGHFESLIVASGSVSTVGLSWARIVRIILCT